MIPLAVGTTCVMAGFVLIALVGMWAPAAVMAREALVSAGEDRLQTSVAIVAPQVGKMMQTATEHAMWVESLWNISLARNSTQPVDYLLDTFSEGLWAVLRNNPQYGSIHLQSRANRDVLQQTGRIDCMPLHDSDVLWLANSVFYKHWGERFFIMGDANWANPLQPIIGLGQSYPCSRNGSAIVEYFDTPQWEDETSHVFPINASFRTLSRPISDPPHAHKSSFVTISMAVSVGKVSSVSNLRTASHILREARENSEIDEWYFLIDRNGTLIASSDPYQEVQIYSNSGRLLGMTAVNNESAVLEPVLTVGKHIMSDLCNGHCNVTALPKLFTTDGYTVSSALVEDQLAVGLDLVLFCVVKTSDVVEDADELNIRLATVGSGIMGLVIVLSIVFGIAASRPISEFSLCMQVAANLQQLDELKELPVNSRITEIGKMKTSLRSLVKKLIEYRSYLPSSMFIVQDSGSDTDSNPRSLTDMDTSRASQSSASSLGTGASSTVIAKEQRVKTDCSMFSRVATLVMSNIESFHRDVSSYRSDKIVQQYASFITIFTDCIQGTRGTLDLFVGDHVQLSWNTAHLAVSSHSSTGMRAACRIRDVFQHESLSLFGEMGISVTTGRVHCGNVGNKQARSFNVSGLPAYVGAKIAKLAAEECGTSVVANNICYGDGGSHFDALPLGSVVTLHCCTEVHQIFSESRGLAAGMEWMYEMDNGFGVKGLLEDIQHSNWESIEENHIEKYITAMRSKLPLSERRLAVFTNENKTPGWVREAFSFSIS